MKNNNNKEINVYGARVHNLKNVSVTIPRNKLTVFTGLSGSGKSSLAFDTIYAEGQRRYIETFSAYARHFLNNLERPDVDKITGLSPVISIEQKTTNKNPRSTVGTITEIYDFLRLLYARASDAFSYETGEKMIKYTDDKIISIIEEKFANKKTYILSPVVKGRKGHYKELFEQILRKGFLYAQIDGEITELSLGLKLDRYKNHTIDIVVDKLVVNEKFKSRLKSSVATAMKHGKGVIIIYDAESKEQKYFSRHLMCPTTGVSYNEPAPHSFSFNSPNGACKKCNGLGIVSEVDISTIIPDTNKSITNGGIIALGKYKNSLVFAQLEAIAKKHNFALNTPIKDLSDDAINTILYGSGENLRIENPISGFPSYFVNFEGIIAYITKSEKESKSRRSKIWAEQFVVKKTCDVCNGQRLRTESLHFKVDGKNIAEVSNMDLLDLKLWFENIEVRLSNRQNEIARDILKEIRSRIGFLLDVGLEYLTLNRSSRTLSGGESQRIRLATQIGSRLVNVLYILDEPSIGLHQRDNHKLIQSLKDLRDTGNTVIVVEHDKDMILESDYIVDIGPGAGRHGGEIVASDNPKNILKLNTLTADYLNGTKSIEIPKNHRKGNGKYIEIIGASGNNLKNIDVKFPLGKIICVTGVSGSGKSSLINNTLHPALSQILHKSLKANLPYKQIKGIENIDKVIEVSQSPIGRTPRSNPLTYTGVFTDIRKIYELVPEAKIRGYKAGRFSFNVKEEDAKLAVAQE